VNPQNPRSEEEDAENFDPQNNQLQNTGQPK